MGMKKVTLTSLHDDCLVECKQSGVKYTVGELIYGIYHREIAVDKSTDWNLVDPNRNFNWLNPVDVDAIPYDEMFQ